MKLKEKQEFKIEPKIYKELYNFALSVINTKFKSSLEYLRTANRGYEPEDFAQDVILKLMGSFHTKRFPSMKHLKSFVVKTIEYHYLYERRKYFYIKQYSGCGKEDSIDRMIDSSREVLDTLYSKVSVGLDNLQLKQIFKENLCLVFQKGNCFICKEEEIFNLIKAESKIISLNYFLQVQYENTNIKACRHFKDKGIYITWKMLESINNKIYEYCLQNNIF